MENKRPTLVTVICILEFMAFPLKLIVFVSWFIFPTIMVAYGLIMPLWFFIFSIVWAILLFVAVIFIWKMRKVGLVSYAGLTITNCIAGFISGFTNVTQVIGAILLIGLLWTQFKKMSWGYNLNEDSLVQDSKVSPVVVGTSEINSVNTIV